MNQEINDIAHQTLEIISDISIKSQERLNQEKITNEILGGNSFTDNTHLKFEQLSNSIQYDNEVLAKEPAFMRVDLEDIDGSYFCSFYVSRVAVPTGLDEWRNRNINFISYRTPLGRIASLLCGDEFEFQNNEYYISRKVRFTPKQVERIWDCFGIEVFTEHEKISLESFRDLIISLEEKGIDVEAFLHNINEENQTVEGKIKQLTKNIRVGMDLRSQAALDKYQDEIFRLPIDSQRIILGPPGTGKTTTLIKRLGQKLDVSSGVFSSLEHLILKKLGKEDHGFNDWLMFTPSELLKAYLVKAFNAEGIAIQNNLKTLDYSKVIARQTLGILNNTTSKSGFSFERTVEYLKEEVIDDPRLIYSTFQAYIEKLLNNELINGLETIEQASTSKNEKLIEKLRKIIDKKDSILSKYRQLFELEKEIKNALDKEKSLSDVLINKEKNLLINKNPNILEELALFLKNIKNIDSEEDEDEDEDDDEIDESPSFTEQSKALVTYLKFLKRLSRNRYTHKSFKKNSNDAKLEEWFGEKIPNDEILVSIGCSISLQNGFRKNLNCWKQLYKKPVKHYKKFRKDDNYQYFYDIDRVDAKKISQAELDLLLLIILRNIKQLLQETYVNRNIDLVSFQELNGIRSGLFKDQIFVDEATDFSVLQLACMHAMCNPLVNSFIAGGDFNQRLTQNGIKDLALIEWISPQIDITRINTIYRQSPKLNDFTHAILDLMKDKDSQAKSNLPDFVDFMGLNPVLKEFCFDIDTTAQWIIERIIEIERLVNQESADEHILPSIVVLVKEESDVSPMTDILNDYLEEHNLKAIACLKGQSVGEEQDIRVCNIEYIKGLEFEAVFFVNIDELINQQPNLYEKYLYVGATRAANYLGITCADVLPEELEKLRLHFIDSWDIGTIDF